MIRFSQRKKDHPSTEILDDIIDTDYEEIEEGEVLGDNAVIRRRKGNDDYVLLDEIEEGEVLSEPSIIRRRNREDDNAVLGKIEEGELSKEDFMIKSDGKEIEEGEVLGENRIRRRKNRKVYKVNNKGGKIVERKEYQRR